MDENSTLRLTPLQLSRLLGMGCQEESEQDAATESRLRNSALLHMLGRRLPWSQPSPDALQATGGAATATAEPLGPPKILDVLLGDGAGLDQVTAAKAYGKELARANESDVEHAAAVVVYYAAVAAALLLHDRKITRHDYDYLDGAFAKLIDKPWVPPGLVELFGKARELCRGKAGRHGHARPASSASPNAKGDRPDGR